MLAVTVWACMARCLLALRHVSVIKPSLGRQLHTFTWKK